MSWWTNDLGSKIMGSITEWALNQVAETADALTLNFIDKFKPDIGYFNQIFPSASSYYQAFTITGFLLIVGIFSFSLLFLLVGQVTGYEESPVKMIGRAVIAFLLTAYSGNVMNEIYKIGYNIFDIFKGVRRPAGWTEGANVLQFLGETDVTAILRLVLGLIIVWNILLVFLEIIERYFVMCLFWYSSPIVNATFVSSMTSRIFNTFYTSVFIQVLICSLNVWFMRMTIDVCLVTNNTHLNASGVLLRGLMVIAWLKVVRKIDDYLRAMGFGAVRTASSIGNSIVGTVMAIRSVAGMATNGKKMMSGAMQGFTQTNRFVDMKGKSHTTEGNKDVSNAAFTRGGFMSKSNDTVPNQDAFMATDQKGNAVATIVGDAGKETAINSNIPGFNSPDVKKETLKAGSKEGEQFKFSYETQDGSQVSGHVSRIPEENGIKGIPTVGKGGNVNYTYFDKGAGLPTGTGLKENQTTTIYDANNFTASKAENGEIKAETAAWSKVTMDAMGFEKADVNSHLTLEETGKIRVDSADGKKMGVVITSDNKHFEAAKNLGNYYFNPQNGNQTVGFPESNLEGLSLEPEKVMNYAGIRKIVGDDPMVKGNQTLATDGIQSFIATTNDGKTLQHDFVTADNLNYDKLKDYKRVSLPNGGTIYHRSNVPISNNVNSSTTKSSANTKATMGANFNGSKHSDSRPVHRDTGATKVEKSAMGADFDGSQHVDRGSAYRDTGATKVEKSAMGADFNGSQHVDRGSAYRDTGATKVEKSAMGADFNGSRQSDSRPVHRDTKIENNVDAMHGAVPRLNRKDSTMGADVNGNQQVNKDYAHHDTKNTSLFKGLKKVKDKDSEGKGKNGRK